MITDATTRQAAMLLAGSPHTPPIRRLLEPDDRSAAFERKYKACEQFVIRPSSTNASGCCND